ncbi:MAG TPA: hypothetical protein VFR66_00230 [Burkholderiales bacterium]|nr:hypothetical protein [Burkholderiales bacterium]
MSFAIASSAHAGGVVVVSSGSASGIWLVLGAWTAMLPRPVPEVSPHHIRAEQAAVPARDSCIWVAGVRHCPLPELPAQPNPPRAEAR